jgi:hypothetical protein
MICTKGYVNSQKKIDAALDADSNADLTGFDGQMMMGTTTSAYRLRAVAGNTPPVWEHVVLADATTKEGAKVQSLASCCGRKYYTSTRGMGTNEICYKAI